MPEGRTNKRAKTDTRQSFEGSHEEVLVEDIRRLLSSSSVRQVPIEDTLEKPASTQSPEKFSEIDVQIVELSSTGDGIGLSPSADHAYVVPFSLPGDTVRAKAIRTSEAGRYTTTDFVRVISPSNKRDDSLPQCPYFAKCGGCQFQMMKYEDQLAHKKTIVDKAYRNFSGLAPAAVPIIPNTIGSPLQYGYRTKLTPHFGGPPGMKRHRHNGPKAMFQQVPPIGFLQKGTRWTIDIEDCPIGTDAVRAGMKQERARVTREIAHYHKGATLLLRESTERVSKAIQMDSFESKERKTRLDQDSVRIEDRSHPEYIETKTCITDSNAVSTEYVDSHLFANTAGSFFQNNNSILPTFTEYIRTQIKQSSAAGPSLTHLIDAYCGSGLFTISLSSLFESSIGIDISVASIDSAKKNAELNKVKNTTFIAATASELFRSVKSPPDQTAVVIDPPRKGCDESFLKQLLQFGPRTVIYVSCNVHTQARDVGVLVNGLEEAEARYSIKSLQGFDFFPQTGHVEGVAVLERVSDHNG
ncbi:MAG: hypothetical protein LQ340_003570 [Diploschistes diacapsis]|nr:MAG: hypothetical protein LQ340_003570 [Diploschistes diacapsis]